MKIFFQIDWKPRLMILCLILLGMILSYSACAVVPEREYPPRERRYEPADIPPYTDLRMIQGVWLIKAIGFPGKLEFYRIRQRWAGRINFDPHQPWDELTDISFNPQTGEIQFARPRNNQWYTGTLIGQRFKGTLIEGGRNYYWEARRDVPIDLRRIKGVWLINAIGFPGKLEFYWTGHEWAGRINFDPHQPWDPLTDIFFDPKTGELEFSRPRNNQWYSGFYTGNRMTGTLIEGGKTYNWEARRY